MLLHVVGTANFKDEYYIYHNFEYALYKSYKYYINRNK